MTGALHRVERAAVVAAIGAAGCLADGVDPAPPADFSVAPVDPAAIERINPLGHMTTPFNALPQARIYLVLKDPAQPTPVRAPAGGVVSWILGPKPDFRLEVQVNARVKFFFDHVVPEPGVTVGARVEAGQPIATHSGATCCVDFGILNEDVRLTGYVNRRRFSPQSLQADAPLKYFVEPVRSRLYGLVYRAADGLDGRHDYDRPGRLVGSWFLEGTPEDSSLLPEHWPKQLAFAYSNSHPDMILVSIAGTLALVNLFGVHDGAPDPATVSVSSGLVTYRLFPKSPPVSEGGAKSKVPAGVLLVQMLDDSRIRVEAVPGATPATAFGAGARVYTR